MNNKPIPKIHAVNINFCVGKCTYNHNISTNECVRVGSGPMSRYYPLDDTSLNDRMAKEFIKNIQIKNTLGDAKEI